MTEDLIILSGRQAKRYIMKKSPKPMTVVRQRLFPTFDKMMWKDHNSDNCMIVYPIDSTQPVGVNERYVDPDIIMSHIDVGRPNKKNSVGFLGGLMNFDGKNVFWIVIAIIILLSVVGLI